MNNNGTNEKICTFFVSDYHFEMKSLPYISKNLKEDKNIIVLTENDLNVTMNNLIIRTNLNSEIKQKILKIDWKANDLNKFKKIKTDIENNEDILIFIKGKLNYIKNINKNLEKLTENYNRIKIVDCYDMLEIGENIDDIMNKYKIVLNTSGEKEIEKL